MKIFLDMVGCRLNQAEIEKLSLDLVRQGHQVCIDPQDAELIIVNTCCVTAKASADSRKMIRHYQRETSARVLVTGCWPSVFRQEAEFLSGSDLVVPNLQKQEIARMIGYGQLDHAKVLLRPELGNRTRTRAFVKVQDGCDNHCSYCLTRIARGSSHSIPSKEVVSQISELSAMGIKEVVLTGVQLGSWGKDLHDKPGLGNLIQEILGRTDIPRLRLSSIEPWDVTGDLLACWKDERVCRHLHIPLQSGSDVVLRRMRRPCSTSVFMRVMEHIRAVDPRISVTTDVIVGFPGETEQDFEQTLDGIRQAGFTGGHVFRYSPMPGTEAAGFLEQVPDKIKDARSRRVQAEFQNAKLAYARSKVGKTEKVLWEAGKPAGQLSRYSGLTSDEMRVTIISGEDLRNRITEVKITGIDPKGNLIAKAEG